VHRDGVGATAADDRVRSSHLTSRDEESILSAGRSLHLDVKFLDVKFLAATGAMKVVTATVKLHGPDSPPIRSERRSHVCNGRLPVA
jgi:hypothetical protein